MLRRLTLCLALLALAPAPAAAADALLPHPPKLEPNVRFWLRVYTEVDGNGGLVHDSVHLDVVYEILRFPPGLSERARERRTEAVKDEIAATLRTLARGKRTGLSAAQRRVLSRWPEGTTDEALRKAARRLRFQLGQADKFRAGLIRQGAWKQHIERTLAEHGVPRNLVSLPHVESSYNARAYSRMGAAGLWQFTRSTGRRYLRVDNVVDERLDPFASTTAAARLLRDNYRRTKSWPLAITAYNHGVSGISRAMRKLGTDDMGEIATRYRSRTFGFASRNFYSEFLAADDIDQNAERYFGPLNRQRPVEYEIVEIPHFTPVSSVLRALSIGSETLREHNLALRPAVWNGAKYVPKGYALRVPVRHLREPAGVALARIPDSERMARQHRDRLYKVRRGDTLSRIAHRYGVRERELVALNNLRSRHRIRVGQVLTLPDHADGGPPSQVARAAPPANGVYTVRRGDTLSTIARRFGLRLSELVALNDLRDAHRLAVGQRLRLQPEPEPALAAASPPARPQRAPAPVVVAQRTPPAPAPVAVPQPTAPVPEPPQPAEPPPTERPIEVAALPQPRELRVEDVVPPETLERIEREAAAESGVPRGRSPATEVEAAEAEATRAAAPSADATAPGERLPSPAALVAALDFEVLDDASELVDAPIAIEAGEELGGDAAIEPDASAAATTPAPDPSNYAVTADQRIVVQAEETLGHYAEWLEVRTSTLRRLNRMRAGSTVVIGRTARLDFSRVTPETFERRRLEYHHTLQEEFFGSYVVTGTETHTLRRGDTLWSLAREQYKLPIWLLRQYNPDVDFGALYPGTPMVIPTVEARTS